MLGEETDNQYIINKMTIGGDENYKKIKQADGGQRVRRVVYCEVTTFGSSI